jgi:putative flippase GtrA
VGIGALSFSAFGLKLGRFGAVGLASTLIYVVVATAGARATALPILAVNAAAYVASGVWSYVAHYHITFRADVAHRDGALRFLVLFMLGYVASSLIVFLNQGFGLPSEVGTIAVALFLPAMNFVVMQLWVFARRRAAPARPGE